MTLFILGFGLMLLLILFTMFHSWYQAHTVLADGIFFALVGLAVLSWVVTLIRWLWNLLEDWRDERVLADLLAYRVRQARANGQSVVSMEGLF